MKKSLIIWMFALLLVPASLFAQEKEKAKYRFGLTFPEIGVIWHLSENIAFVPGIEFSHGWSSYSSSTFGFDDSTSNLSHNTLRVNAGLRIFISEWKDIRFYISPKYGFGWVETKTDRTGYPYPYDEYSPSEGYSTHLHKVSAAWGIQYAISDRINIFGDIGATYDRSSGLRSSGHSNTIGTEGTWGLILYLK